MLVRGITNSVTASNVGRGQSLRRMGKVATEERIRGLTGTKPLELGVLKT